MIRKRKATGPPNAAQQPGNVKAPCVRPEYILRSLEVRHRHVLQDDQNQAQNQEEWISGGGGVGAACITMRTNLRLRVRVDHDATSPAANSNLRLSFNLRFGNNQAVQIQSGWVAHAPNLTFDIDTGQVVSRSIDRTRFRASGFQLAEQNAQAVRINTHAIDFQIYTIFGAPLADNVRESTLVDPGVQPGQDEVERLQPFFIVDHLRQACEWAQGASRLGTDNQDEDIVYKLVRTVPQIEYGEGQRYFDVNDGWNVWDNPQRRTGDCSQQASFFADVLGTLGVRARDFELKCEHRRAQNNRLYRRYFGDPNPDDWPTHGVVLVRYGQNDFRCYDTSFHNPRIVRTLAQSLQVGQNAPFLSPSWQTWCYIPDQNPNNVRGVNQQLEQTLTQEYPENQWRQDMEQQADQRFPQGEIQQDPGP